MCCEAPLRLCVNWVNFFRPISSNKKLPIPAYLLIRRSINSSTSKCGSFWLILIHRDLNSHDRVDYNLIVIDDHNLPTLVIIFLFQI